MVVDSNNVTILRCEVFAIPMATVRWTYVGRSEAALMEEVFVDPMSRTVVAELTLDNPDDDAEGNYTCNAVNPIGSVARTVTVRVRSESVTI